MTLARIRGLQTLVATSKTPKSCAVWASEVAKKKKKHVVMRKSGVLIYVSKVSHAYFENNNMV